MARLSVRAGAFALGALFAVGLTACAGSRAPAWRPPPSTVGSSSSYVSNPPDPVAKPPYPLDPDPNAVYCLCWVPPTYHKVPKVVCCQPECYETEKVFRRKIEFTEVCEPGCYTKKKCPDRCRTEEIVEACPGHVEWVRAECECGPCKECYRPCIIPPTYKKCEKTVTDEGVEYCAFKPPKYDVVADVKTVCVDRPVHVPGKYVVEWVNECFQPGHWEWRITKHCDCAPPPPCGCPPLRKGDFSYAPARD